MIKLSGSIKKGYVLELVTVDGAEMHVRIKPDNPYQAELSLRGDYAFSWEISLDDAVEIQHFLAHVCTVLRKPTVV